MASAPFATAARAHSQLPAGASSSGAVEVVFKGEQNSREMSISRGYLTAMTPPGLKGQIRTRALELGFSDCRIAPAKPAAHRALLEQWVAEGKYGDMTWMARNLEWRGDPREVLPGANSVIVFALNYFQG